MPRSSATTMYIASSVAAVALIVIDVDTRVERDPVEQRRACPRPCRSPRRRGRPRRARAANRSRCPSASADRTRRRARSGPASSSMPEALVRLARRAEAGVLAHRPEAAAVHRRLHAARERERPGIAEIARRSRRARRRAGRPAATGMPEGETRRRSEIAAGTLIRRPATSSVAVDVPPSICSRDVDVALAADEQRRALVQLGRAARRGCAVVPSIAAPPACSHDERQRIRLVEQPQLALRALACWPDTQNTPPPSRLRWKSATSEPT